VLPAADALVVSGEIRQTNIELGIAEPIVRPMRR
jgi:hypothetical protein